MPSHPAPFDPTRLMTAFRAGDRAAWDTLYEETAPRLLAWAQTLTSCRSDAEDLVQETFVAAYLGAGNFNRKSRLLTWLFGIALRKHRDKSRTPRPKALPLCDEVMPAPLSPHAADTLLPLAYRQAVFALPDTLRDAFVLVAQHGFTHKEAAQILSIPEGTAKWRVAEATRRLRVALVDFAPSAATPSKEPSHR